MEQITPVLAVIRVTGYAVSLVLRGAFKTLNLLERFLKMPLTDAQKQAIDAAVAAALKNILDALAKEKGEVVAIVQDALTRNASLTAAELQDLVTKIQGIGSAAAAEVDKLSTAAQDAENSGGGGAPAGGGGTQQP